MKKITTLLLLIICFSAIDLKAQNEMKSASPVLIYEIPYSTNGKPDTVLPDISAISNEYRFFCDHSSVMYVEVTKEQAELFEKVMNELRIPCMKKNNCTLDQVRNQCVAQSDEE